MPAYVADADLKSFLRIQGGIHDAEVNRAVEAAHRDVDRYCGWNVVDGFAQSAATASVRLFQASHYNRLHLNTGFWTTTDLVVKTDEDDDGVFETTWAATDYELRPANNIEDGVVGFPYYEIVAVDRYLFPVGGERLHRVEITAKWGWQTCPPDVSTATLLRTSQIFQRRETRDGVNPLTGFRAGGRDRDWMLLLDDYRHPDHKRWCG